MQEHPESDAPDSGAESQASDLRDRLDRAASQPGGADLGRLFSEVLGRLGSHADSRADREFRAASADVAREAGIDGDERYRDLGFLAKGGMGELRRVQDVRLRRVVASKRMHPDALGEDDLPVLRFIEEAQVASQLEHPGVVPIHDLAVDAEGHLFFTMRLVEGDTLSSALGQHRDRSETWTQVRLLEVLVRICDAVAFAHDRGVLHRDLKPQNVLLGRFGEVYVTDWGLAKLLDRGEGQTPAEPLDASELQSARADRFAEDPDSNARTVAGSIVGTPNYMPPEQAGLHGGVVDERSDVYGLGSMLYELLAGAPPYSERGRTSIEILTGLIEGPPLALSEAAPQASPELIAICERAMARERAERYPSAEALRDDLRAYLENRVVRAHRTGPWAELRKWYRRNRAFATTLLGSLLIIVGGLGVFSYFQQRARLEIERLADLKVARDLLAEQRQLWPAHPERIDDFSVWLEQADALRSRGPAHRERLASLLEIADESLEGQWIRQTLDDLIAAIDELEAENGAVETMRWRLDLARGMTEATLETPSAEWDAAAQRVLEHPDYGGLVLTPQLGLVPLGPDPASGFELFAVWGSGEVPLDLDVAPAAEDAIVLVLVPALEFRMGGVRALEPTAEDEEAILPLDDEEPAHLVPLEPFFIGKYEVTQGQWERLVGQSPSGWNPEDYPGVVAPGVHPVEQVSWLDATAGLRRLGLVLPTEAQWEAAARAGTEGVWWTGSSRESLRNAANFSEESLFEATGSRGARKEADYWPGYYDGWATHAPVGTFPANPFGLHEVMGNVFEWCRDAYAGYGNPPREGDGLRSDRGIDRVYRGGGWNYSYLMLRLGRRQKDRNDLRLAHVGLRAARALDR